MNLNRLSSALPAVVAALLVSASANAAIVSFDFALVAQDGSTVGTGSFSYDDSILDAGGNGIASPTNGGLELDATIFGIAFDETNDEAYDIYPQVDVDNFLPVNLNYILLQGDEGVDFAGALFNGEVVFAVDTNDVLEIVGGVLLVDTIVGTIPTPAPAALALFGLGALGLGLIRRR